VNQCAVARSSRPPEWRETPTLGDTYRMFCSADVRYWSFKEAGRL